MASFNGCGRKAVCIALILCLLSFLLLVQAVYEYKSSKTDEIILEEAKEDAHNQAHFALKTIVEDLDSTRFLAEEISKDLSSGKLKDDFTLRERLLAEMENNSDIFSIGIAYSPAVNAGKLHSLYFKRNGSYVNYSAIQYNYTDNIEKAAWYNNPLKKGWCMEFSLFRGRSRDLSDRVFGSFLSYGIRKQG